MPSVGNYYLTISPQFKSGSFRALQGDLSKGLNAKQEGEKAGKQYTGGLSNGLSALKVAAGTMLGNALSAGISYVAGFTSEAIAASDATDKFKSTLDFAGLDTSQIDALTVSCQRYADETVYDLSDIQSITAQLASNNVKDFDRLAEAAGNLNAVAGGNKDTFKSVGMVLTQTAGQGKLTTENFNQLADAIPGASGKIQQELANMGAYTGNFRDAMAAGEISAEEFNQAILNLGFQDAAIEAATSATTMEGAMGNLEASIQNALKNGFDLIKPAITGAISAAAEFIDQVPGAFQTAFEATSEALSPFIEQCANVLGPAIELLVQKFLEFCEAVAPVLIPIFQALGEVIMFVAPLIGEALLGALDLVIQVVTAIFDQLTVFLDWMSTTFGPFWNDVLLPAIQIAWEVIQNVITVAVSLIETTISAFIGVVSAIWSAFWGVVGTVVETVWNTIQTVIQTAMGVIQGIISVVMGLISGNWQQVWDGIKQIASSIWEAIKSLIQIAIDAVKNTITNVLNGIKGVWDSIWNAIKGLAETVWNGIKSTVETAINAVKSTIDSILNTIKSLWDSAWNTIKNAVTTAWDGIKNGVSNGINEVVNFVSGLPDKILGALGDLGSLLWNAGKSIIDGFLGGLKSAWGAVTSWIGGIGDWIASHKGPIEYDRKLLIPAGTAIMSGFNKSLEQGFRGVMGDVRQYASRLDKQISATMPHQLNYELDSSIRSNNQHLGADVYDAMIAASAKSKSQPIYLVMDGRTVASVLADPLDGVMGTRADRVAIRRTGGSA